MKKSPQFYKGILNKIFKSVWEHQKIICLAQRILDFKYKPIHQLNILKMYLMFLHHVI